VVISALVLAATLVTFPAAAARAGGVRVALAGDLPCARGELIEALTLRITTTDAIAVQATGDRVQIRIADRTRELDLGGVRGAAAARLIALAAADLILIEEPAGAPAPPAPVPWGRIAVGARLSTGAAPKGTFAVDLTLGRRPPRVAVELGVGTNSSGATGVGVSLLAVPVRAAIAFGNDVELRAGAVAIPHVVDYAGYHHTDVLWGAGLEGRGRIALDSAYLVLSAGLDVFANQLEYRYDGTGVLVTPRVQIWSGLGVAWELGR